MRSVVYVFRCVPFFYPFVMLDCVRQDCGIPGVSYGPHGYGSLDSNWKLGKPLSQKRAE